MWCAGGSWKSEMRSLAKNVETKSENAFKNKKN